MQGVHTQGMCTWGCVCRGGGDTQPIRLQVGTLSQSDYRCAQGVHAQGVRTQGMRMQGVHAQGWWGHSANQITGGDTQPMRLQVCAGGVHAGGAHTGDVHAGGAHAGVVGTSHVQINEHETCVFINKVNIITHLNFEC